MQLAEIKSTEERASFLFQLEEKFAVEFVHDQSIATVIDEPTGTFTFREPKGDGVLTFTMSVQPKFIDWLAHKGWLETTIDTPKNKLLGVRYSKSEGLHFTTQDGQPEGNLDKNTRFVLYLTREFKGVKPILLPGTQLPKASAEIIDGEVWYPVNYVKEDIRGNRQYTADLLPLKKGFISKNDRDITKYTRIDSGVYILATDVISLLCEDNKTRIFDRTDVSGMVVTTTGVNIINDAAAKKLGYTKRGDGLYSIKRDEVNERIVPWKPSSQSIGTYHKSGGRYDMSNGEEFVVGLEIEKIDDIISQQVNSTTLQLDYGWTVERDGSLDPTYGFELISPKLPLFNTKVITNHLESLRPIIDSAYTTSCGGHIHVSSTQMSNDKLFDSISGFLPLLFSIYPERAYLNTCQAKSKSEMARKGDKYQSVHITGLNTVELRIFPAVANVESLQRRLALIRFMVTNKLSYEGVLNNLQESDLYDMLRGHFSRVDYNNIVDRLVYYTETFEKKTLIPNFDKLEAI